MTRVMLGPPVAVAGGAETGTTPGGQSAGSGASEEFMALMAGLLAGFVPTADATAQTDTQAPGPNDGKVPTEFAADADELILPQGLAQHATLATEPAILAGGAGVTGVAILTAAAQPSAGAVPAPQAATPPTVPDGLLDGQDASWRVGAPADPTPARTTVQTVVSLEIARTDAIATAPPSNGRIAPSADEEPLVAPPGSPAPAPAPATAPAATGAGTTSAPVDEGATVVEETAIDPIEDERRPAAARREDGPRIDPAAGPTSQGVERTREVETRKEILPAHSPRQLAHELVDHLRMAVRQEGKEIQVHLRPPELGNLTIRVVTHDGILQAFIAADRPEAARLLEQSLGNLEDMLADRGYELGSVDVDSGERDANEARTRGDDTFGGAGGSLGESDDTSGVVVHDGDVNLLA